MGKKFPGKERFIGKFWSFVVKKIKKVLKQIFCRGGGKRTFFWKNGIKKKNSHNCDKNKKMAAFKKTPNIIRRKLYKKTFFNIFHFCSDTASQLFYVLLFVAFNSG